jgi:hypothetical protein
MKIEGRKPYLDEAGEVHWPMLVFYPEGMQQDVVEDCCESDTLQQHLDVVGGRGGRGRRAAARRCVRWLGRRRSGWCCWRGRWRSRGLVPGAACCCRRRRGRRGAWRPHPPTRLPVQMFGPEAPPLEWDFDSEYTRDRVELYHLSHAGAPLERVGGAGAACRMCWPMMHSRGSLRCFRSSCCPQSRRSY